MRKILAIVGASLLVAMSMGSVAFAQSSVDGYDDDRGAVENQIQGNDDGSGTAPDTDASDPGTESGSAPETATATKAADGSLPFTGLDLALLAGAGAVLLGLGVGMRHLTRGPESV